MSFDADHIVDRRRMRRKLTFWRVAAAIAAVVAVAGGAILATGGRGGLADLSGGAIARVHLDGLIRANRQRTEALDRLAKSNAKAVILHINSPGGTVAGSEQLYNSLRKLKEKKPLVVVVDGLAASGGYMAAIAADHIVAQRSSVVGSIGIIFQYPNVHELLKTVGVQVEAVRSTPLKAAPSGYEPTSPEARAAIEALVSDSYDWFRAMVGDRRSLEGKALDTVADGRVFSGRQALELKLIDELGHEDVALQWLARTHKIDPETPIRNYPLTARLTDLPFLRVAAAKVFDAVGLSALAQRFEALGAFRAMDRLNLDGLLALWHPPAAN